MKSTCEQNEGNDIHDIQQQEKCLHETLLVYRDVLKKLSSSYSDLHKYLCENFSENISEICNLPESDVGDNDQTRELVLNAYSEMKKVQSEYGSFIKLEALKFTNQGENLADEEFV